MWWHSLFQSRARFKTVFNDNEKIAHGAHLGSHRHGNLMPTKVGDRADYDERGYRDCER
jgi:hypothetical protein